MRAVAQIKSHLGVGNVQVMLEFQSAQKTLHGRAFNEPDGPVTAQKALHSRAFS
jgi:hypothetical protein